MLPGNRLLASALLLAWHRQEEEPDRKRRAGRDARGGGGVPATRLQVMNPTVFVGMPRQGSDRLSPY